ncbi:ImmA/IrrE family metallo-endopeptidase [Microbacterium sp. X-17]|uniref:ImmA/IrrE family metallo-endopeptidase n=1 Tax=Microbacterium sp. X-17 TaxID=3144404 RepID=UPI0031F5769B
MTTNVAFHPKWVSAPGDTILDVLGKRHWTVEDLADHIGLSDPETRRIVVGEKEIDGQIADRLATALGGSSDFWLTRERRYRDGIRWLAVEEISRSLPIEQMADFGWIASRGRDWHERAEACIRFFGVTSAEEWNDRYGQVVSQARYRASAAFDANDTSVAVWLRQAELEAEPIALSEWNPQGLRGTIPRLRLMTREANPESFIPILTRTLGELGVALAVVRTPKGCPMSGAAFMSQSGRRTIALSARHLTDDHFWFSLMHEVGHVLMHDLTDAVVDDLDSGSDEHTEVEANEFAADALNPAGLSQLTAGKDRGPTLRQVVAFASQQGVAPGVVVGQLQHAEILRPNQLNHLRRRYKWDGTSLKTARR